jgi:hypothetical protein
MVKVLILFEWWKELVKVEGVMELEDRSRTTEVGSCLCPKFFYEYDISEIKEILFCLGSSDFGLLTPSQMNYYINPIIQPQHLTPKRKDPSHANENLSSVY